MSIRSASGRLRLISGLLRAPQASRYAERVSETAVASRPEGRGWIEHALDDSSGIERAAIQTMHLVSNIVDSRIGGSFWGPPLDWRRDIRLIVKVEQRQQDRPAVARALALTNAENIGVMLPDEAWAGGMAAKLRRLGLAIHIGAADPWSALDRASAIVAGGDDDLALLALFAGRTVHLCGDGFLAGRGLTQDDPAIAPRAPRTLPQLAAAALVLGVRYRDPFSGRITDCEAIIDHLAALRRVVDADRDLACLTGIAGWKRARLRRFLAPGASDSPMYDRAEPCVARAKSRRGGVGVWPSQAPANLAALASAADVPLRQIEDGFVRSVGLGSDFLPPCSIVVDRRGIYYDPSRPSELEDILAGTTFSPRLQARAQRLIDRLLAARVTKYNTGGVGFTRPSAGRVVLVPGQVEDDQSFRLGGGECAGNLDLVRRAREQEPDAYIIYRPHPDVEAGNRLGAVPDQDLRRFADRIDRDSAMHALLDGVDAVHVLTSLAGFEALLRGREVVVHGQPFYAGWGLTRDLAAPPRRGRRLTLAELVAGTLILYPRYLDPDTRLLCSPEVLIDRLAGLQAGPTRATRVVRGVRRKLEQFQIISRSPLARPSPLGAAPGGR